MKKCLPSPYTAKRTRPKWMFLSKYLTQQVWKKAAREYNTFARSFHKIFLCSKRRGFSWNN